ncbi:MAG: hypothetical protein ABI795_07775 [Chthoniobacterales bacterium]
MSASNPKYNWVSSWLRADVEVARAHAVFDHAVRRRAQGSVLA